MAGHETATPRVAAMGSQSSTDQTFVGEKWCTYGREGEKERERERDEGEPEKRK